MARLARKVAWGRDAGLSRNGHGTAHEWGANSADMRLSALNLAARNGPEVQRRFNRLLTSCPEMISAKDNFVRGAVVEEMPSGSERVLGSDGCLAATLGPCRLTAFALFLYSSIVVGGGVADAYDCSGDGASGTALSNGIGGGTIVG